MSTPSIRCQVMAELKRLAGVARNGRYFVKRGAINWAAFDFEKHGPAIAVMMDDTTLLRPDGNEFNRANLALEVFAPMPDGSDPGIDDGLLDELLEDAESIICDVNKATTSDGQPLAFDIVTGSASAKESSDVDQRVQGVVCQFTIRY